MIVKEHTVCVCPDFINIYKIGHPNSVLNVQCDQYFTNMVLICLPQVSRLTPQKGVHLIKHCAYRTLDRGGQFVLLGSAPDPAVQVRALGWDGME